MARAIMVSDHVYNELLSLKGVNESFTMVIDRFIHRNEKKKEDIMELAGAWSFLDKEITDNIEKEAKKARKASWGKATKW